jgi:hypothetical protein
VSKSVEVIDVGGIGVEVSSFEGTYNREYVRSMTAYLYPYQFPQRGVTILFKKKERDPREFTPQQFAASFLKHIAENPHGPTPSQS